MNEEIIPHSWPTELNCVVYVDDILLVNTYKIEVGFDTSATNPTLHDIAFEKVQMFFDVLMSNSVIITKTDFTEKKLNLQNNFIELPDLLNDQTLGVAIFSKLLSMVKEDLEIIYVKISSTLGKNVCYTMNANSPEFSFLLPNKSDWWGNNDIPHQPWWLRDDPATYDEIFDSNEFYKGEFTWEDHFSEELDQIKSEDSKNKFRIISGGKDETNSSK